MNSKPRRLMHRAMPLILGGSLVKQIVIALVLGILLALVAPGAAKSVGILGGLFVSALKAVAPVLVFVLVAAAIANHQSGTAAHMRPILVLYLVGTFAAATTAVITFFLFPVSVNLISDAKEVATPGGIGEVLQNLVYSVVDNPVKALMQGNYICILFWAIGLGIAIRKASDTTRLVMNDISDGVEFIVRIVIRCAPIGIFGLVASTFATEGLGLLVNYAQLLVLLVGSMLFVALVLNPLIVWVCIRKNPYPLTFQTLRESGITAFFTRSSAANIPVNINLCKRHDQYGRCGHHDYDFESVGGLHDGRVGGHSHRHPFERGCEPLCLRRSGCARGFSHAHSACLLALWSGQFHRHAGGGCGLCDWRGAGLLRNGAQFLFGRALYGRCLHAL